MLIEGLDPHNGFFRQHLDSASQVIVGPNKRALAPLPKVQIETRNKENVKENIDPSSKEPLVTLTLVSPVKNARRDVLMPNLNLQEPECFREIIEVIS